MLELLHIKTQNWCMIPYQNMFCTANLSQQYPNNPKV